MGTARIDDSTNLAVKEREKLSVDSIQARIKRKFRIFFSFHHGRYLSMCICRREDVSRKGEIRNKGRRKYLKTCGIKHLSRRYRVRFVQPCVTS